jgi:hypothetical protein
MERYFEIEEAARLALFFFASPRLRGEGAEPEARLRASATRYGEAGEGPRPATATALTEKVMPRAAKKRAYLP